MGLALAFGTNAFAQERDVDGWMESANFILGVYNVEDMVQIPGTRWIVGSGVTTQGPGMNLRFLKKNYLHFFDAETETGGPILGFDIQEAPDPARFPDTTTPPDWEVFGPHGIALGVQDDDQITLYAVNHGVREAVQVFEIDVSGETPAVTWVGTVLSPENGFVDAVTWVPGTDGFVATALLDPRDPEGEGKSQMAGEPVGWVREWQADTGWETVPGTEDFSAPNGIVVNEDGSQIFVAPSGNFAMYRINRGSGDPETMETEIVMPSGVYGALGAGTTAIEVGDRLWVSSTGSDRVGIFDLEP